MHRKEYGQLWEAFKENKRVLVWIVISETIDSK